MSAASVSYSGNMSDFLTASEGSAGFKICSGEFD